MELQLVRDVQGGQSVEGSIPETVVVHGEGGRSRRDSARGSAGGAEACGKGGMVEGRVQELGRVHTEGNWQAKLTLVGVFRKFFEISGDLRQPSDPADRPV